jgi:capsule polysaccharide export protein KpsC/LpsZ
MKYDCRQKYKKHLSNHNFQQKTVSTQKKHKSKQIENKITKQNHTRSSITSASSCRFKILIPSSGVTKSSIPWRK